MSKAMMAGIPVVLIAIAAGLGFSGVVNIPGITPQKEHKKTPPPEAKTTAVKVAPKKATPALTPTPKPKVVANLIKKDPDQGADALAAVWSEMKVQDLVKVTEKWNDADLAKVLMHMEPDKVAKLLSELTQGEPDTKPKVPANPERASKLSKILQDQGSIIKTEG
jgi:hypothetical protein